MSETDLVNTVTQALCPLQKGDWVEILDGSDLGRDYAGDWNSRMKVHVGQICQVIGKTDYGLSLEVFDSEREWHWDPRRLRRVEPPVS